MKKIISLILTISALLSVCCTAADAAGNAAPPTDGLAFWVDAGAQDGLEAVSYGSSQKVNKWLDISGN